MGDGPIDPDTMLPEDEPPAPSPLPDARAAAEELICEWELDTGVILNLRATLIDRLATVLRTREAQVRAEAEVELIDAIGKAAADIVRASDRLDALMDRLANAARRGDDHGE
jgi:hypothetical protein